MRLGAFELQEPVPKLRRPRLLAALQPWVDVGSVGSLTLAYLEEVWQGRELARLTRPGYFFDFTRYRPMTRPKGDRREITLPNTVLQFAQRDEEDWLFLHAMEPHANGEEYVEALVELLGHFEIQEYVLIGSMYAPVPHTRPSLPVGGAASPTLQEQLQSLGVRTGNSYEGPTSVVTLVQERLLDRNIPTAIVLFQLPAYAQLEQDYRGQCEALELLQKLYGWKMDLSGIRRQGERQYAELDETARRDPRLKQWLEQLESVYDTELESESTSEEGPPLSPGLESFLKEMEGQFDKGGLN